jgi:hypothetical protein
VLVLVATVAQLVVATFVDSLSQFEGKGFTARLVAYPLLMLLVPAVWAWLRHRRGHTVPLPWDGFALIMAPFLIDVTGNTLDLYDSLAWWDDANHLVNWFLLSAGIGVLLLRADIRPPWALGVLVAGVGALLAIGWELGEWYSFIRDGTELETAYEDTLGDQALGTLGAVVAAVLIARRAATARGGWSWRPRHRVKLMSDYTLHDPLWDDEGVTDAAALRLSPALESDIRAWQEHFETHFAPEVGWDSERSSRWYEERSHSLRDRLQRELGDNFAVTLDLWPVAYRGSA